MQKYTDYGTDLLQPKSRVLQILAHFTRLWSFTKQNTRITQKQTGGTNLFSKWFTKLLDKERLNSSSITLKGATSLHSHAFHQDTDVGMYFSILLVFSGLRCMEISSLPPLLFWSKDSRRTGTQMIWPMNIKHSLHPQPRTVKWLLSFH